MTTSALTRAGRQPVSAVPLDTGLAFIETGYGRLSLSMHRNFDDVRSLWEGFQSEVPTTHAQAYATARLWYEGVASRTGAEAVIFTGRSSGGTPLFILPLQIVGSRGIRTLEWIGQEHANYNMGLFDPHFAQNVEADDMWALLKAAVTMAGSVSIACFRNQPREWEGIPNPLYRLPNQASPNSGYAVLLDRDFETLYRNRFSGRTRNSLRRKERKLRESGDVDYVWAKCASERQAGLKAFFTQKAEWFQKHGISDPFADSGSQDFYRALADLPEGTPGRLEVGYLKAGDTIAATFHGAQVGRRFHMLLSSIDAGETERWSPGILLMRQQISDICARGCTRYDLGCGQAQHKVDWCDDEIALFDSFLPLSETGHLLKVPMAGIARAKGWIKNDARLWTLAQYVRRLIKPAKADRVA